MFVYYIYTYCMYTLISKEYFIVQIFGPILPVIVINDLDDAISFINERCVYCNMLLIIFNIVHTH